MPIILECDHDGCSETKKASARIEVDHDVDDADLVYYDVRGADGWAISEWRGGMCVLCPVHAPPIRPTGAA